MTLTEKQIAEARKVQASEGGVARAKKLSKKRRSEIARNAARAKWSKPQILLNGTMGT
jgi:hypothetical protein